MSIAEKIRFSVDKERFTLFKEGLFYKTYNADAMVFVQKVKAYKVSHKLIKSVGAQVLSVGFPASEINKGNLTFEYISERIGAEEFKIETKKVSFYLKKDIKQGFDGWHDEVVNENSLQYTIKPKSYVPTINEAYIKELVAMIKNFDLANSTPMEGLSFIQRLKKEILKIEGIHGVI